MMSSKSVVVFIFVFFLSSLLPAQQINGRFSSSVYSWEKFDTVGVSKVIARGFQTLQLDITQGDVSLQSSMYGAANLNGSFGDEGKVRLSNLFLRWKNIGDALDVNLGRIPVFAGVGNGIVDGALLKARASENQFTFIVYGGANVRSDLISTGTNDLNKNFLIGGQIISTAVNGARLGVSYVNRNIKRDAYIALRPDSLYNLTPLLITPESKAEQVIGADARYDAVKDFSAYGRYDYDLNAKRSLRVQFSGRYEATAELAFTADYIYREPRIIYNTFFSVFPTTPVREYEGGIEYGCSPTIRAFGKLAYVKYIDDISRRLTAGLNTEYGSLSYSGANGYAGQLSSWYLQVMYPLFERRLIPTLGFSFATYRPNEVVVNRQDIFAGSFGCVVRPHPAISFDAQVQWLRNPVAQKDVRVFGKVNYWFHHVLDLFRQKEGTQ